MCAVPTSESRPPIAAAIGGCPRALPSVEPHVEPPTKNMGHGKGHSAVRGVRLSRPGRTWRTKPPRQLLGRPAVRRRREMRAHPQGGRPTTRMPETAGDRPQLCALRQHRRAHEVPQTTQVRLHLCLTCHPADTLAHPADDRHPQQRAQIWIVLPATSNSRVTPSTLGCWISPDRTAAASPARRDSPTATPTSLPAQAPLAR